MRVKNSILNVSAGIGSQIIITLLSFISRTVFIGILGVEYLGINGLFTNILGMLSLVEIGIGTSIVYSLYKPVAEDDQKKIYLLMQLYKKAYMIIALVILLLGLAIIPFLDFFINNASVENVYSIYLIFLSSTVASYLFQHKISLLKVCQKTYIVTWTYSVSTIAAMVIKLAVLYFTRNYILYLVMEVAITIITSIVLSNIVNKLYPDLRKRLPGKLDSETNKNILKNIKSIVIHNIGGYCVVGTDNILISSFVSLGAVGLYSNYLMLLNICKAFINQFFDNIYHSIGNLVAVESKNKVYSVFKVTMLFNFWIYSLFTILLYIMIEPFIHLWLGSEFIMGKGVLIFIMINFFVTGMRRSIYSMKIASGIFHADRFAPIFEATVNLGVSIILVQQIGIVGVFIGTLASTLAVPFWLTPYLVYKKVFDRPVAQYFLKYSYFTAIGIVTYLITNLIADFITSDNVLKLLLRALICFIIPNVIYFAIFHRTDEFKYLLSIVQTMMGSLLKTIRRTKKFQPSEKVI